MGHIIISLVLFFFNLVSLDEPCTFHLTSQFHTVMYTTNFTHLCGLLGLCLRSPLTLIPYYSSKRKDGKPNPKQEHFPLSLRTELSISHTSLPMESPLWSLRRERGEKGFLKACHREEIIINLRSICSIVNDHTSNYKPIFLKIETHNH